MIKLAVILLFAVLLLSVFSSVSYVKKASASGECPSGQIKDWAGICFNKSEAKACLTCAPGSAAAAEKPNTPPPKVQVITIPPPEKPLKSTSPPKPVTIPAPNQICTKPPCTVTVGTVTAPKGYPMSPILGGENPHSLKNLVNAGIDAVKKAWDNRPTLNQMVNSLYPQGDGGGDTGRCLDINQNPIPNCNPNE
jgi:hypothetical protein